MYQKKQGYLSLKSRIGKEQIFLLCLCFLTLFRIFLAYHQPIYYMGDTLYDDDNLIAHAISIYKGNWLGAYSNLTLIKGITYPLTLILIHVSHIPYFVFLTLFIVFSAALFSYVIKDIVKSNYIRGLGYLMLIWAPFGYVSSIATRLYRNAFSAPLALVVISSCIGLYFSMRNKDKRKIIGFTLLEGFSLLAFMYLREDAIWIVPFVLASYVITLIEAWIGKENKKVFLKRCLTSLMVFVILLSGNLVQRGINYANYGVAEINDRTSGSFKDFCMTLVTIEPLEDEPENEYVWVSKEKLARAIDHSDTLKKYEKEILEAYSAWGDEINGDLYMWALREAGEKIGYYQDARSTKIFWAAANADLQQAIEEGELDVQDKIFLTSSMRGLELSEFPSLIYKTFSTMNVLNTYKYTKVEILASNSGSYFTVDEVALYTNSRLLKNKKDATSFQKVTVNILSFIHKIYKYLSSPIFYVSLVGFVLLILQFVQMLRKRNYKKNGQYLIMIGLLLIAFEHAAIVQLFCSWIVDTGNTAGTYFYGSSFTVVIMAFEILVLGKLWEDITKLRGKEGNVNEE